MKKIIIGLAIILLGLQSCNSNKNPKNTADNTSAKKISDLSIYNLPSKWTNQNGKEIEMKDLKGKVLVMVMIYISCKSACLRLVVDM